MPEKDLRALQSLIRGALNDITQIDQNLYRRRCLAEADALIDEVIKDFQSDCDRVLIHVKVYRIMILAGEGGAYGANPGP